MPTLLWQIIIVDYCCWYCNNDNFFCVWGNVMSYMSTQTKQAKSSVIQTVNKLYAENRKNITKAGYDFSLARVRQNSCYNYWTCVHCKINLLLRFLQFVYVLNKTPACSVVIGYCIHKFNRNLCNLDIILSAAKKKCVKINLMQCECHNQHFYVHVSL